MNKFHLAYIDYKKIRKPFVIVQKCKTHPGANIIYDNIVYQAHET